MEYSNPEQSSQSQYDEISAMALDVSFRLNDCDALVAQELVDRLNMQLIEDDLFSRDILIRLHLPLIL